MDIMDIREYCLSLPMTEETTPFDLTTLVYKVGGKMFALADLEGGPWVNLKCEPQKAVELREQYDDITPGWHMNKKHWNTVNFGGDLPAVFVRRLIDESYLLVVNGLPKDIRAEVLYAYEKFRTLQSARNP